MRAILLISALMASTGTIAAPDLTEQRFATFEAYLDGLVKAQFRDYKLAGMTFSMVHDGRPVMSKGFGVADLQSMQPVNPDTHMFRPGSVSKLFTWTAVMQLVEQGRLDLDADVSQYVHQFDIPNNFDTPMTLKHLLTHTPGLEDGAAGYLFGDEESDLAPLHEVLARYRPDQVRRPGAYSSYSNWATALAGLIVANVSGQSFESYVTDHILAPLNMRYSTFDEPLPEDLAPHMATGYFEKAGALEPLGFEFIKNFGPAGALSASAADMASFMLAHLNQGSAGDAQILQPDTVAQMHSNLFGHHPGLEHWAHGFYEYYRNGQRFIGHGGDTIAFHSQLILDTNNGFGFFLSFNAPQGASARKAIVEGIVDYFYPVPPMPYHPQPLEGTAERIAQVVGDYRITRRSYTKLEGVIGLGGDVTVAPAGDGAILLPIPSFGGRFMETEPYLFTKLGSQDTLAFGTNDAGEVTHAFIGILSAEKLSFSERASTHQIVIMQALVAALFVCINAVRNRGTLTPGPARFARRMTIAASASILAFVAGMGVVMADFDMQKAVFDFPPGGIGLVLVFPLLTTAFTIASLGCLVPVWRSADCSVWARLRYTYVVAVFTALVAVLHYWNLLGWNYY